MILHQYLHLNREAFVQMMLRDIPPAPVRAAETRARSLGTSLLRV